ncbi:MAG: hypothetical protein ACQES5_02510 [Thermodesulfobacteriota bacterium]
MKPAKYNVLFMRDDRQVKRFRFSLGWIKFFIAFLLFLLLVAGLGGYFSFVFFSENRELNSEVVSLRESLEKTQSELKRLQNIRDIVESFNEQDIATALQSRNNSTKSDPSRPNLAKIFKKVDKHIIALDHIQARIRNSSIHLRFELNNLLEDRKVQGRVNIALVSESGKIVDMDVKNDELSFEINHFKKVGVSFKIPKASMQQDLFALRLSIVNENKELIYSETFPFSDISV